MAHHHAFRVIEFFEQQEHVAATLSAQALALAAIPANPDALDTSLPGTDVVGEPSIDSVSSGGV